MSNVIEVDTYTVLSVRKARKKVLTGCQQFIVAPTEGVTWEAVGAALAHDVADGLVEPDALHAKDAFLLAVAKAAAVETATNAARRLSWATACAALPAEASRDFVVAALMPHGLSKAFRNRMVRVFMAVQAGTPFDRAWDETMHGKKAKEGEAKAKAKAKEDKAQASPFDRARVALQSVAALFAGARNERAALELIAMLRDELAALEEEGE